MRYEWTITVDHLDLGIARTSGPWGVTRTPMEIAADPAGHRFRLRDDDGEVYAEGVFVGNPKSEDGFAPLDDYGVPALGATEIQYFEHGGWATL